MTDDRDTSSMSEEDTCIVHTAESRFEADVIGGALDREGIPFVLRKHEETAYDGIFLPQKGWGAFLVPMRFREKASRIIQELLDTFEDPA